jgi:hypothetical protein
MTACGPSAGGILSILAHRLRAAWHPAAARGTHQAATALSGDVVLDENPPGSSEPSGLLRKASVHSQTDCYPGFRVHAGQRRQGRRPAAAAGHAWRHTARCRAAREIETGRIVAGGSRLSIGTLPRPGGSASRPPGLAGRKALPPARQRTGQSRLRQQQHRKGSRAAAVTGKGP